jgi:hypothetical protein
VRAEKVVALTVVWLLEPMVVVVLVAALQGIQLTAVINIKMPPAAVDQQFAVGRRSWSPLEVEAVVVIAREEEQVAALALLALAMARPAQMAEHSQLVVPVALLMVTVLLEAMAPYSRVETHQQEFRVAMSRQIAQAVVVADISAVVAEILGAVVEVAQAVGLEAGLV